MTRALVIGKHLATFNVFREADGLYVTCADASGVRDELGQSGAPLHLCAMNALREAMRHMDERAAIRIEAGTGGTVEHGPTRSARAGAEGIARHD